MKQRISLKATKRLVVKVGTSTLTHENGKVNLLRIDHLARVLTDLQNSGIEVVLVTSGAIGIGVSKLNLPERPTTVRGKQAAAAVGQSELMHLYSKLFGDYGCHVAQILLTKDVIEEPRSKQNAQNTLNTLFELGVIPIVNENDTIAIDEIESGINNVFGDNDTLSAIVANLCEADLLILLSDINGLYTDDPRQNPDAQKIDFVEDLDVVWDFAKGAGSKMGTGGMSTKLQAAKIAIESGIPMVLCQGSDPKILYNVLNDASEGTLFMPKLD